jgi:probable HAF family extracellular repeat protein
MYRKSSAVAAVAAVAGTTALLAGGANATRKPSETPRLEVISAVVSGINDRGKIVGTLTTKGGVQHGFAWRKGSLKLFGAGADEINERGQVLGQAKPSNAAGPRLPFLWKNGKRRAVGLTSAWGLNDRGQVIGDENGSAAIWQNGVISVLPLRTAIAINDQGQVVGMTVNGDAAEWQDGKLTDLGTGYPRAINDRGEIVGDRNGDVVVWQNGNATDLGPGYPVAINERGDVIWFRMPNQNDPGVGSALLWQDGRTIDLGDSTPDQAVVPLAISNTDQVVGEFRDYDNGTGYAFVWQNGTTTRLPLPKRYVGLPLDVVGMNDHNQIVGDDCGCSRGAPSKFAVLWTLTANGAATHQLLLRLSARH